MLSIAADKDLAYARHDGARIVSNGVWVHRHVAPRNDFASLGADDILDGPLLPFSAKKHCDAALAVPEEIMRDLHEQPGAIARLRVVTRRAPVHKTFQDRHAVYDDFVARLAREVRHHPDATRIVFVFAAIESLLIVFAVHFLFLKTILLLPISQGCAAGLFRIREAAPTKRDGGGKPGGASAY